MTVRGKNSSEVKYKVRSTNILDILDIVLVDDMQHLLTVSERPPLGHSDHSCVEFSLLVDITADIADSSCYYMCMA